MVSPRVGQLGFLAGGGAMADLIRAKEWDRTPLGPIEGWPLALKASLGISLNSRFPVCIYWGHEFRLLYNDPWSSIPGDRHPWALGRPAHEAWPDIWDVIGPMFNRIMDTGVAVHTEDGLLAMHRYGYTEECYFNYNVSPIYGDEGVLGLFNAVIETTYRVLAERRAALLGLLANRTHEARSISELCVLSAEAVRTNPADLPFCLLYLVEDDDRARLAASTGLVAGGPLAPRTINLKNPGAAWPLAAAAQQDRGLLDEFAKRNLVALVLEPWPEPVKSALILPISNGPRPRVVLGYLVAGISPRRSLDDAYRAFLTNVAGHIASRTTAVNALHEERLQTEVLERQVEERTRERDGIWRLSRNLLLVTDPDGVFIAVNPAWEQLLGWSEEELLGKSSDWLLHPDDRRAADVETTRVAAGAPAFNFETRLRHKNGHYLSFAWSASFDEGRIYAVARDITHEKAAAEALQEVQQQLRQSQKMEAIGQLTGGIAHDFNNLLQGITGSLDLIQRRIEQGRTENLGRFIASATTSANRAAALTHRLLAFSRRQPLDPKPLEINPLLASMESMIRRTVGESIEVELDLGDGLWRTNCDPNQLESAVLNLVLNSREAMADGGTLIIKTTNETLDSVVSASSRGVAIGNYVCVSVTDTGAGMKADVAERAFEPFFTTKPMGQGAGLGLSMIYGFTRQSEGYAKIQSEPGNGTTVMLYLPKYQGKLPDDLGQPLDIPAQRSDQGKLVLVVEDEVIIRDLVVEELQDLGCRVLDCGDATQALDILRSVPRIDLMVTDIGLPGMNGRQLADTARIDRPTLKILFMTGYAENAMVTSGFLQPGMAMITKPFAMEAFTARVRETLEAD